MRILLTCNSLLPAYGGPAFSVSRLALALAQQGAAVGIWAADQSTGSTSVLPSEAPVSRLFGREEEAFDRFGKVDVLHDNGIWLAHHHRLASLARRRRVARVISTRGMLEPWARNHKYWKKAIAWNLYQRRDLVQANYHHTTSRNEAKNLQELKLAVPVCMIPNGVEIPQLEGDAAPGVGQSERSALFLGRLYDVKGIPLLIEAWGRVRPKGWRLTVAGPDEAGRRSQLERKVAAAGLTRDISFVGPLDGRAKQQAFRSAQLFILPSLSESFGMVIGEALAYGLPVLTTTGTPWPTLVQQGCGWWVAPTIDGLTKGTRRRNLL